jgi:hypothetical protein
MGICQYEGFRFCLLLHVRPHDVHRSLVLESAVGAAYIGGMRRRNLLMTRRRGVHKGQKPIAALPAAAVHIAEAMPLKARPVSEPFSNNGLRTSGLLSGPHTLTPPEIKLIVRQKSGAPKRLSLGVMHKVVFKMWIISHNCHHIGGDSSSHKAVAF